MARHKGHKVVIGFTWLCLLGGILGLVLLSAAIGAVPKERVVRAADRMSVKEGGGTPFHVQSVDPSPNNLDIDVDITLAITTSGAIRAGTVTSGTWRVHGGFQGCLDGEISLPAPNSTRYDLLHELRPGERVQATASNDILDVEGGSLVPYLWEFWVATSGGSGRFVVGKGVGPGDDDTLWGVALGDIDGDEDLDLAVGNVGQNVIYLNDGDGTFDTNAYGFGGGDDVTTSLAFGDLDGDGHLDLAVGNSGRNMVYLNDGDGTFDTTAHPVGLDLDTTWRVVLGDVDGDGDLDLVVGNWQEQNAVYFNEGDGTFAPVAHGIGPGDDWTVDVGLGDLDGDGDLDVAVANYGQSAVYLNDGDGTFDTVAHDFGEPDTGSTGVALADLDGDGDLDLAVSRESYRNYVFLNDGDGTFDTWSYIVGYVGGHSYGLDAGDLDGDGDADLVFGNYVDWNFAILNNGDGTFDPPWLAFGAQSESTHGVRLGDVDGDGDLDAAIGNLNRPNAVYLNAGPADLSIVKAVVPPVAVPGDMITYTLTYANGGPDGATGVVITDRVPVTLTHVSYAFAGAPITPTGSSSFTWSVGALGMDGGGRITVTGRVTAGAAVPFTLTNRVGIGARELDPNPLDNVSVVASTVAAPAGGTVFLPLLYHTR
jgi:uncharacterized repeat protein (TIGR01451 family)